MESTFFKCLPAPRRQEGERLTTVRPRFASI